MSILPALLLTFSAAMKFVSPAGMAEGFTHLGWPVGFAVLLGVLEFGSTLLYVIPRTSILGAILLTGYMGGAIATHVRIGEPVYTHVLLGILIWGGLYLREPRLRALMPLIRRE